MIMKFPEKGEFIVENAKLLVKQIKFAKSKVVRVSVQEHDSTGISANYNGIRVDTTSKSLDQEHLNESFVRLEKLSKLTPNSEFLGFNPKTSVTPQDNYDPKLFEVSEADLISLCEERFHFDSSGVLELYDLQRQLNTSYGLEARERTSNHYFSIRMMKDSEKSIHKVNSGSTLKTLHDFNLEKSLEDIPNQSPVNFPEGNFQVLIKPLPLAIFLESIGSSSSIHSVENKLSFLKKDFEGDKNFTLYDDPLFEEGFETHSFDDEGTQTKKKALIENGSFKTYVYNNHYSKKYGVENTGNAGLVSPHPTNLILEAKQHQDFNDLVKQIKKGLIVTNVWYMRFQNYFTGEFSCICRDACYYVENGSILYPVKNARINGIIPEMFKNVIGYSNDFERIHSWEAEGFVHTPSILFDNVKITNPVN